MKKTKTKKVKQKTKLHPHCVICQNEGIHDLDDRPHVMEGQE